MRLAPPFPAALVFRVSSGCFSIEWLYVALSCRRFPTPPLNFSYITHISTQRSIVTRSMPRGPSETPRPILELKVLRSSCTRRTRTPPSGSSQHKQNILSRKMNIRTTQICVKYRQLELLFNRCIGHKKRRRRRRTRCDAFPPAARDIQNRHRSIPEHPME